MAVVLWQGGDVNVSVEGADTAVMGKLWWIRMIKTAVVVQGQ